MIEPPYSITLGQVQPASAITVAGIVLSQPLSAITASNMCAWDDELDRVGDHLAADQRGPHPLGAHRDPVGDRDRVQLHRRAAGGADPLLDLGASARRWKLHGIVSIHVLATATSGLASASSS